MRARIFITLFVILITLNTVVFANDDFKPVSEDVIRYQEVFFHYYRKDEFNALVSLTAGIEQKNILNKTSGNELLLGSLYSTYDLPELAEKSLLKVASNDGNGKQRDLALFYLAKQYYQHQDYLRFIKLIKQVGENLQAPLLEEKYYMTAMVNIHQKKFDEVENILDDMSSGSDFYHYLTFNLGAAYFKSGNPELGEKLIRRIGKDRHTSQNMLSLRDKSNIVLGYYYIRESNPESAIAVLENVRLNGPFSNKALLGLGWAYSQQKRYRKALVPWLALSNKSAMDITVQEAKLASAFAFRQLGAEKKAMESYKSSIKEYETVKKYYHDEIASAFSTSVFASLLKHQNVDDYRISQTLHEMSKTVKGEILLDILGDEKFQKMLNDYRDLKQLQNKIMVWRQDAEQMNVMLDFQVYTKANGALTNRQNLLPNQGYREQLITLNDTLNLQNDRLEILLGMYEEKIRDEYVRALNKKQQYLIAYLSQARFALAEILDKARKNDE